MRNVALGDRSFTMREDDAPLFYKNSHGGADSIGRETRRQMSVAFLASPTSQGALSGRWHWIFSRPVNFSRIAQCYRGSRAASARRMKISVKYSSTFHGRCHAQSASTPMIGGTAIKSFCETAHFQASDLVASLCRRAVAGDAPIKSHRPPMMST